MNSFFIQNSSPGSIQQQTRHKRISAVTMAKIQQKQQIQALLTSAGSPQWKKLRHPVQAKFHPGLVIEGQQEEV